MGLSDAVLHVRHAAAPPNIQFRLPPKLGEPMRSGGQVFAVIDDDLQPIENVPTY
jgi:hypothetical protein